MAAGAAVAIAVGCGLGLGAGSKSKRVPLPAPSAAARPANVPVEQSAAEATPTSAVAVIESVAPTPNTPLPSQQPVSATALAHAPVRAAKPVARRTATTTAQTAHTPPPDADVDLLAAMVARLQAAEASADTASAALPSQHRPAHPGDDSRTGAR